jgi:hypothetical protein
MHHYWQGLSIAVVITDARPLLIKEERKEREKREI